MKNIISEKIRSIELPFLKFDTNSKDIINILFGVVKLEKTVSTYKNYIINEYIKESKEIDKFRGNERVMTIVDSLTGIKSFESKKESPTAKNIHKTKEALLELKERVKNNEDKLEEISPILN